MIERQGGNPQVIYNYGLFKKAGHCLEFKSGVEGYIQHTRTDFLGTASMLLGAGRETKESIIDYAAGIILEKKTGMQIKKGDVIARLYTNKTEKVDEALKLMENAFTTGKEKPLQRPLILEVIE